jgi:hypothetical protein
MPEPSRDLTITSAFPGRLRARQAILSAVADASTTILMDVSGERYYTLNEVGSRAWAFLAEPTSVEDLIVLLAAEYEVPIDVLTTDTIALLNQLAAASLITVDGA